MLQTIKERKIIAMKRKIIIIVLVIIAGGIATGAYLFNKPRQSVMDVDPAYRLSASTLVSEFEQDEAKSNEKYLGKVIEVSGIIDASNIDEKGILNVTLRGGDLGGVGCQFESSKKSQTNKLTTGQSVMIKGICTGILIDVVLVDCVING